MKICCIFCAKQRHQSEKCRFDKKGSFFSAENRRAEVLFLKGFYGGWVLSGLLPDTPT